MQINLGKDAIPIPKDQQCSVSVISTEILNNIYSVDSGTNQSYFLTNTLFPATAMTTNRITLSALNYTNLSTAPVNTAVVFSGNVSGATNGVLTAGTTYYLKAFFAPNQFNVSATISPGTILTGFNSAYTPGTNPMYVATQGFSGLTSFNVPFGTYTATTLASKINNSVLANPLAKITCTSTNNILTISTTLASFYFPQAMPMIGIMTPTLTPANSITCSSMPFLQQKYLQIGTSFRTSRNQPLCKIPVNGSFGSYILYNPQILFPVNINDDLINSFQISLLDETNNPINNNYADWSVTIQIDFKTKSNYSLKDE